MPVDQKNLFHGLRNYLAGRVLGATRDPALLDEVMKCLLARKYMLRNGGLPDIQDDIQLARDYRRYFKEAQIAVGFTEEMLLDPISIRFVHERLSQINLSNTASDPVGDLFETFIGSSIRGAEGQFFTPQNAGRWLVDAVAPVQGERVIDPACGAGGFLTWAYQHARRKLTLIGIEKDEYLARLARARTYVAGIDATIHCANALSFETDEDTNLQDYLETFDVVLTNPPFGKNIVSVSTMEQQRFELGYRWHKEANGRFQRTSELTRKVPPQVLFIERVVSLLKKGGRAGLIVPESLLSNRSYAHVVDYIREKTAIRAVVGMPESLFKSSGKGGTHTKTCLLILEKGKKQTSFFMAEAKWCGNDSRGRAIEKDDLPKIARDFTASRHGKPISMGYLVDADGVTNNVLAPRYHEPSAQRAAGHLASTHTLVSIRDLIDRDVIRIDSGDEVGKMAYGTGPIPFVRTSDISGWEVKIDPKHCVAADIYERLKQKQDVRANDILLVRDGTYLIGSCTIITKYDERIVYQSHILKIRCLKPSILSPHLLLAVLSSQPVQRQIKSKTFTQDIIDSLGSRVVELVLPISKKESARRKIEQIVKKVIADRVEARELARAAKSLVVEPSFSGDVNLSKLKVSSN
jgi:type I restriction enzyme M protein